MSFNFENTEKLLSAIKPGPDVLRDIEDFHSKLNTGLQDLYSSVITSTIKAFNLKLTALTKEKGLQSPEFLAMKKLLDTFKKQMATRDDFIEYFFDDVDQPEYNLKDKIKEINLIFELNPQSPIITLLNNNSEVYIKSVISDIGISDFLQKKGLWKEELEALFLSGDEPEYEDFYGLDPNDPNTGVARTPEEIAQTLVGQIDQRFGKSVKILDVNYGDFVKEEIDSTGGRKSAPGAPSAFIKNISEANPSYNFIQNANTSSSFFGRLDKNLSEQIEIKNKLISDGNKIDITSYYPPFASVPNQNSTISVENNNDSIEIYVNNEPFSLLIAKAQATILHIKQMYTDRVLNSKSNDWASIEKERYNCAMHLDDLALAMKERDRTILSKVDDIVKQFNQFGMNSSNVFPNVSQVLFSTILSRTDSELARGISYLASIICFPRSSASNLLEPDMKKAFGALSPKSGDDASFEEAITKVMDSLSEYSRQKTILFFDVKNNQKDYSLYISRSINLNDLINYAASAAKASIRKGWKYIKCPTCTKSIYHSEFFAGTGKMDEDAKSKYGTIDKGFEEVLYLPIRRSDNSIITDDDLNFDTDGLEKRYVDELNNKKSYSWSEIEKLISSSNDDNHNLGLRMRSFALMTLGAKEAGVRSSPVKAIKTKCPFTDMEKPKPISGKSLSITDFKCGMSIDFDQMSKMTTRFSPLDVNIAPSTSLNQNNSLKNSLDELIQKGILMEEDRAAFTKELEKRMSGGWKNSSTVFVCPCKFSSENKVNDVSKYKYLAFPTTGIVGQLSKDLFGYSYPTSEAGDQSPVEDGTASYIVCGNVTSLSAFVRDSYDNGSLQSLLKASFGNKDKKIFDLVNILISNGVDFYDVQPYLQQVVEYAAEASTKKLSSSDNATLRELKKMAVLNLGRKSPGSITNLKSFDILKDLKLVCSSGHKFSIGDSVNFGKSHHAYDITYSSGIPAKLGASGVLSSSGVENFNATMNLRLPYQISPFIMEVPKSQLYGRIKIENWNGDYSNFSNYYFENNGKYYIFNDINQSKNSLAWGTPTADKLRGDMFYSADFDKKIDQSTMKILEMRTTHEKDSVKDGKISSVLDKIESMTSYEVDSSEDPDELTPTMKADIMKAHTSISVLVSGGLSMIRDFSLIAHSAARKILAYYVSSSQDSNSLEEFPDFNKIIDEFKISFYNEYYKYMSLQDLRLYDILGESISIFSRKNLIIGIIESLSFSIEKILGVEKSLDFKNKRLGYFAYKIFDDAMHSNINAVIAKSESEEDISKAQNAILSAVKTLRIKDPKKKPRKTAPTKAEDLVIIPSKIEDVVTNPVEQLSISNMRASEYLARVLSMCSAIYVAESINDLWRKFFDDRSANYIGYNFSQSSLLSLDNILSKDAPDGKLFIADDALASIRMAITEREATSIASKFDDKKEFVDKLKNSLKLMVEDYKLMLSGLKTTVANQNYLNKSLDMISNSLLKKIEQSATITDNEKRITSKLIENCMVAPPITTIDLSREGKYDNFYNKKDRFRKLPAFNAKILKRSDIKDWDNIAYYVADSKHTYCDFGINIVPPEGYAIVLSRAKIPNAENISSLIIGMDIHVYGDWNLFKIKESRRLEDVSVSSFYHPYTFGIDEDGIRSPPNEATTEFVNDYIGLATSSGFSIGQFTQQTPLSRVYPPVNNYETSYYRPGFIIPIEYSDFKGSIDDDPRQDHQAFYPIFNSRIPVEIASVSNPEKMLSLDICDFLARDPYNIANAYLEKIFALYKEYTEKLENLSTARSGLSTMLSNTSLSEPARRRPARQASVKLASELKSTYKIMIESVFSKYRELPLFVVSTKCSSSNVSEGYEFPFRGVEPGRSGYVPLLDYVTINKLISMDAFSPEFGGHRLWNPDDIDGKNEVISSFRHMLIEMNGLEVVAKSMNEMAKKYSYKNIISNGMISLDINAYDILSPYSDPLNNEVGLVKKISKSVRALIESLIAKKIINKFNSDELADVVIKDLYKFITGSKMRDENLLFYQNSPQEASASATEISKKYPSWTSIIGKHFSIASDREQADGMPSARINMISDIFPFDAGDSKRLSEIKDIQDPDGQKILKQTNLHGARFLHGRPLNAEFFLRKEEYEKQELNRKKILNRAEHTGAVNLSISIGNASQEYILKYVDTLLSDKLKLHTSKEEAANTNKKAISLRASNLDKIGR